MSLEVLISNKGKQKLNLNGHSYHLEKSTEKVYYWCCANRKEKFCKSRLHTIMVNDEHILKKEPSVHSHEPVANEKHVMHSNNSLKTNAKNSTEKAPCQIIRDTVADTNQNCRVYLPSKAAQKIKIKRIRSNKVKEPQTLDEINIPEDLKFLEGELFVLDEKEFGGEKNILLGTQSSLKLLEEAQCWLMDGTFHVVPSIMTQLFSIHGYIQGQIVPLVFCLMSRKTVEAYSEVFFSLTKLACEWNIHLKPLKIISDFEKAIINTAKQFFPYAECKGCQFHFGQIIWRKIQKEGLSTKYGNSEEFSLQVRMIRALAFVPGAKIPEYYEVLYRNFADKDAKKIARWINCNYIEGRYDTEFWSVCDMLEENFPRTQNSVEAWHRRLKVVVGKKHAGLYSLIENLAKEVIVAKSAIEKVKSGNVQPRNKKNCSKNQNLKAVFNNIQCMDKTDYLKAIAVNLAF